VNISIVSTIQNREHVCLAGRNASVGMDYVYIGVVGLSLTKEWPVTCQNLIVLHLRFACLQQLKIEMFMFLGQTWHYTTSFFQCPLYRVVPMIYGLVVHQDFLVLRNGSIAKCIPHISTRTKGLGSYPGRTIDLIYRQFHTLAKIIWRLIHMTFSLVPPKIIINQ
jgi:hypothetical protein